VFIGTYECTLIRNTIKPCLLDETRNNLFNEKKLILNFPFENQLNIYINFLYST